MPTKCDIKYRNICTAHLITHFLVLKSMEKYLFRMLREKNIKREWGFYVHHICKVDPTDIIYIYEQFNSIIVLPIKS